MVDGDSTTGSGIVIPLNDRGGVFDKASPGAFGDGLSRRCFFFARLEELSNCPRVIKTRQKVGREPGKNQMTVIFRLVTISASGSTSAASCLAGGTGSTCSSMGTCF